MCLLVVGGDSLGKIDKNLISLGIKEIVHIDGRNKPCKRQLSIPAKTNLIVVLTDYINHNTSTTIKKLAKEKNIPVVFSKRSWTCVFCKIQPFIKGHCC
ncbi:MAG: DUF2325 domain-containing protein [Bacillota bacterium]|nr:DUF2325 domain-containing protein [Bacillota bacterium]